MEVSVHEHDLLDALQTLFMLYVTKIADILN